MSAPETRGRLERQRRRATPVRGPVPSTLGRAAWRKLEDALLEGARAHGYPTDLWTPRRIAGVIRRELGLSCDARHAGILLDRLVWAE